MEKFKIDCLVIGAGVSGLAISRNLAKTYKEIILIDQNLQFGQEASSRNSEVIHAGIYYPDDSLKSKLCLEGKYLLYKYLRERKIDYLNCGKFIVSTTDEESQALHGIKENAEKCGVDDLTFSNKDISNYRFLSVKECLFSPSTGIFDSHSFMSSLRNEFEDSGGLVLLGNRCLRIERTKKNFEIHILDMNTKEEFIITTNKVINCAGLNAAQIANSFYKEDKFKVKFVKGEYYSYFGKERLHHLIYPLPSNNSLGIHATIDLGKGIRFGPSSYPINNPDYSIDPTEKEKFYRSITSYWPSIDKEDLSPSYSGIRATIEDLEDFTIDTLFLDENILISVLGYVSPGLTSSLALAKYIESSLKAL